MDHLLVKKYNENIIRARFTLYMVAVIMAIALFVQFVDIFYARPFELMILLVVPFFIAILGLLSNRYPSVAFLIGLILIGFFLLLSILNFSLIGFFFFFFAGTSLAYGFWSASKISMEQLNDDNILDNDFFE